MIYSCPLSVLNNGIIRFSFKTNLFEEFSYIFFGLPFGFWYNKYHKYGANKGNSGKYKVARGRVDGVSERGNHIGDSKGDQPVEGGAGGGSYPLGGGNNQPTQSKVSKY